MNTNTRHKILRYLEIYILCCNKPEYKNYCDFDVTRDDAVSARNWLLEHKDLKTMKQSSDAAPYNIYANIHNSILDVGCCIAQNIDDSIEISEILKTE